MKKIVVAIGVFVLGLSSSLKAMEVENGFPGMKRDLVIRLCRLVNNVAKIRSIIGMSQEHFLWKHHAFFVENRIDLSRGLVEHGRDLAKCVSDSEDPKFREHYADFLESRQGLPEEFEQRHSDLFVPGYNPDCKDFLKKVLKYGADLYEHMLNSRKNNPPSIRNAKDVVQVVLYLAERGTAMFSPNVSPSLMLVLEDLFAIEKIGAVCEPLLRKATSFYFVGASRASRKAMIDKRHRTPEQQQAALGVVSFCINHKIAGNFVLRYLWSDGPCVELNPHREQMRMTFLLCRGNGANINHVEDGKTLLDLFDNSTKAFLPRKDKAIDSTADDDAISPAYSKRIDDDRVILRRDYHARTFVELPAGE
ncbi:hypothetical protein FACS189449_02670 [Alphaproteobacteria bacterium]|nr:hypothetical protein FACS189449_02670 [Alphaproteobacteria bacterium]